MSELLHSETPARSALHAASGKDTSSHSPTREIVERIEIAATPARVFQALTTPTELLAWWGDRASYPSTHWELDLRVGGTWLSRWRGPDGTVFALGGRILELRPPHLLAYSWWDERYPGLPETMVRYEIAESGSGSLVTMTHSGFDAARPDFDDYNGGWSTVMRKLRAHAESRGPFLANRDVAIEVDDLVAAEAFYAGTLGFRICSRRDDQLELDAGGFRLWVNRAAARRLSFIPSLDVPNATMARTALEEAGCRVIRGSPESGGFYVEDPFGFVLDVIERRPDNR
jgi:uncharacterized protein YndB with AHSA1/START domain